MEQSAAMLASQFLCNKASSSLDHRGRDNILVGVPRSMSKLLPEPQVRLGLEQGCCSNEIEAGPGRILLGFLEPHPRRQPKPGGHFGHLFGLDFLALFKGLADTAENEVFEHFDVIRIEHFR